VTSAYRIIDAMEEKVTKLLINPGGPLRGAVTVPGDKSISHRALLLGALADGDVHIEGWLPAADCLATLRCIRALGVKVEQRSETSLIVHGVGLDGLREPDDVLDCGGSGTTMRLLAGILAGQPFLSVMKGNEALRRRPMGRVIDPLRQMGATILGREGNRLPPLAILGRDLHFIEYAMPVASAQVKSALLLAALFATAQTTIIEPGPTRDHTERMLSTFGVKLHIDGRRISVAGGQRLTSALLNDDRGLYGTLAIPSDFSSAAFPLVAAALVPNSSITVQRVGVNVTRIGLLNILTGMGAATLQQPVPTPRAAEPIADLLIGSSELHGITVGGEIVVRAIDEFPILTVAATQAVGDTLIRDASELRVKETDRITAVACELAKMGAQIEERPDGLLVHGPTPLHGAVVSSHMDHRLAMALAVAGLVAKGSTTVENAEVIADSFPGFAETMRALGADIREEA
jgi:3-phosphoshikimate 1-carboxyvinyltransferase